MFLCHINNNKYIKLFFVEEVFFLLVLYKRENTHTISVGWMYVGTTCKQYSLEIY